MSDFWSQIQSDEVWVIFKNHWKSIHKEWFLKSYGVYYPESMKYGENTKFYIFPIVEANQNMVKSRCFYRKFCGYRITSTIVINVKFHFLHLAGDLKCLFYNKVRIGYVRNYEIMIYRLFQWGQRVLTCTTNSLYTWVCYKIGSYLSRTAANDDIQGDMNLFSQKFKQVPSIPFDLLLL